MPSATSSRTAGSKPTMLPLASVCSKGANVGSIATSILPRALMSSSASACAGCERETATPASTNAAALSSGISLRVIDLSPQLVAGRVSAYPLFPVNCPENFRTLLRPERTRGGDSSPLSRRERFGCRSCNHRRRVERTGNGSGAGRAKVIPYVAPVRPSMSSRTEVVRVRRPSKLPASFVEFGLRASAASSARGRGRRPRGPDSR